jgi:hypothetical protein
LTWLRFMLGCTRLIDLSPPATITGTPPAATRSAAIAFRPVLHQSKRS